MGKKFLTALLAAACMVFGMSGCRYSAIPVNQKTSETTSVTANETYFNYITDWSIDEIVKNVEMNGVTYSMPFTLNDLGDKYSLELASADFDESGKFDHYVYSLNYCDAVYAGIDVFDQFVSDMDNYKITSITLMSDTDFKFGGIGPESTKADILERFGEPSVASSDYNMFMYMFYEEDDELHNIVVVAFENDNETLKGITIRYNK